MYVPMDDTVRVQAGDTKKHMPKNPFLPSREETYRTKTRFESGFDIQSSV